MPTAEPDCLPGSPPSTAPGSLGITHLGAPDPLARLALPSSPSCPGLTCCPGWGLGRWGAGPAPVVPLTPFLPCCPASAPVGSTACDKCSHLPVPDALPRLSLTHTHSRGRSPCVTGDSSGTVVPSARKARGWLTPQPARADHLWCQPVSLQPQQRTVQSPAPPPRPRRGGQR